MSDKDKSDEKEQPAANGDATATAANSGTEQPAQAAAPGIHVLGQYIKDLSFENPGAPKSLSPAAKNPKLDVNVNVNATPMSETDFEVELKLEASARRDDETLFITEVLYAGVFRLQNLQQEHIQPVVLIECPRLLFPFARQILADATRQGGFPPLMIDPVDFAALYKNQMAKQAVQQQAAAPAS